MKTMFPSTLAASGGHVTTFWMEQCEWQWCVKVLGYAFQGKGCVFHSPFTLPCWLKCRCDGRSWSRPLGPLEASCILKDVRAMGGKEPGSLRIVEPPCPLWLTYPGFYISDKQTSILFKPLLFWSLCYSSWACFLTNKHSNSKLFQCLLLSSG